MVSTTIAKNSSMIRIFESSGYDAVAAVYGWPSSGTLTQSTIRVFEPKHIVSDRGCYRWLPLVSVGALKSKLRDIRGEKEGSFQWLPGSFEAISADGDSAQEMIDSNSISVCHHWNNGADSPCAVACTSRAQLGGTIAMIVANSPSALCISLEFVFSLHAKCKIERVYFDTCKHFRPEEAFNVAQSGGMFEYLLYCKPLV